MSKNVVVLGTQWGDEGKYLDEKRGKQHLAQNLPVFDDGGNEPGKVEALLFGA